MAKATKKPTLPESLRPIFIALVEYAATIQRTIKVTVTAGGQRFSVVVKELAPEKAEINQEIKL